MSGIETIELFKDYLEYHTDIEERYRPFFVIWIEKFLVYLEKKNVGNEFNYDDLTSFLYIIADNYDAWQIKQAGKAICLFIKMIQEQSRGPDQTNSIAA